VSEYQRYEFQAVDRLLTRDEQQTLRRYSSRATITPSSFVVDYSWGSFKGDVAVWMSKYFDAFQYCSNWGSRELMLRLPLEVLPMAAAEPYCAGERASALRSGEYVVLAFRSEDDGGGEWIDEDQDTLATLLPIREELASGDLRALYLAWLACAQAGELGDEVLEPPCPPGLGALTPPLDAFADFLRIDRDLIDVAATANPTLEHPDDAAIEEWVSAMPDPEKASILVRLLRGPAAHVRAGLLRRFGEWCSQVPGRSAPQPRTIGEILSGSRARAEQRRRREAELADRERARRERLAAEERERVLLRLAGREEEAWQQVDDLLATRQPKRYDEAIALLKDLRYVCARAGRSGEAQARIVRLREVHARKPSLLARFRKAEL